MTEDFDTVLDRCLADVTAGQSIEGCVQHYSQYATQLEPLLKAASRVRTLPPPADLSAERAQAIETRLLKHAAQIRHARPGKLAPRRLPLMRLMPIAMAVVLLCSFAGFGVTTASAASLPGDFLYPIKRFIEGVVVILTPPAGQSDLHLTLAQRRLDEFAALADRHDVRQELLAEMSSETAVALSAVENANNPDQQTALQHVVAVTERQIQQLSEILASAPEASRGGLETALAAIAAEHGRAAGLLAKKSPPVTPPGQTDKPTSTPEGTGESTPTPPPTGSAPTPTPVFTPTDSPEGGLDPSGTPPGQGTPGPKVTPPGQGTPGPKVTPPGQGTPGPKKTPPGQGGGDNSGGNSGGNGGGGGSGGNGGGKK